MTFTKRQALEYLAEHGREITMSGLSYHMKRGTLPRKYDSHGWAVFTKDDLDQFLTEADPDTRNREGFGEDFITPAIFHQDGYGAQVERGDITALLDGKPISSAYPSPDDSRAYIIVYDDGSTGSAWNNKYIEIRKA